MKGLHSFYRHFYGYKFFRHFRRPEPYKLPHIQCTIENPKQLYLHVSKNSGYHPCYIHTYDHGSLDNLNGRNRNNMVYDRAYFDFDINNSKASMIKKELKSLKTNGPFYERKKQFELKTKMKNLILEGAAKKAINEAKQFSKLIETWFGKKPLLFFSGNKGCHVYIFFSPSKFHNIDRAISWFAGKIKKDYNLSTMDLAVTKDATNRLSRVPYSKHNLTDLTVVPFTLKDNYENTMNESLHPKIKPFNKEEYLMDEFREYLQKVDRIEFNNQKIVKKTGKNQKILKNSYCGLSNLKRLDLRIFIESILGNPIKKYKNYNLYHCPFLDHEDNTPSFVVYKTHYKCYGCQKHGNYFQFLKDYKNLDNKQVKQYLTHNRAITSF